MRRKNQRKLTITVLICFIMCVFGQACFAASTDDSSLSSDSTLKAAAASSDTNVNKDAKSYDLTGLLYFAQAVDSVRDVYKPTAQEITALISSDTGKEIKKTMQKIQGTDGEDSQIKELDSLMAQFKKEIDKEYLTPNYVKSDLLFQIKMQLTLYAHVYIVSDQSSKETIKLFTKAISNFFIADQLLCRSNNTELDKIVNNIKGLKLKLKTLYLKNQASLLLTIADKQWQQGHAVPASAEYAASYISSLEALKLNGFKPNK